MKKTKLLTLIPLVFVAGLSACGSQAKYKVGVCQLVQHEALDAATKGFVDTLKAEFGADIDIDVQIAAGDPAICSTQVNKFVSTNKNLIMANATPALQAASQATSTIPVLGTSITEYGVALNIPNFSGVTGFNVSGTSDLAPLSEQAKMLHEVFPAAQKVGLLYCASEANSKYQVDVVDAELKKFGLETSTLKFTDSNDISSILTAGVSKIDALYIPTDNTAASNAQIINDICSKNNIPVFAGEEGLCKGCGAITLTISYYNIGVKTGKMAIDILKNGADITKMAIAYDEKPVKKYNPTICQALGIVPPADYSPISE